jgi:dTDP-4-amino-4,6-dideoxygalactose transaminase
MLSEITRKLPVVDLKAQYNGLQDDILAAVTGVLENGHFILGPNVAALECEIATFCQTPYAVGVASGTDALILALRAAGIQGGDEVIVPAFSFVATADAVSILGATPVFCDIDPVTMNMDVDHAGSLINERTRALIPVHLYGQPADMTAILKLARNHQLLIIEDCAQALGACWEGKPVGGLGDFGCISFFPTKNLGAYGDGGMITARNQKSAARLKKLRVHGSERKYCHDEQGMNSRLDELQAAILRVKLPHLEHWNMERRRVAGLYRQALAGLEDVNLPSESPLSHHVYHQFTIRHPRRDAIQAALRNVGVESVVYYPIPLHLQPMYSHFGFRKGHLPVSECAAAEVLSLPIFPEMTEEDVSFISENIERALSSCLRQSA